MPLFKKKLTEQEAATQFVLCIVKEAQAAWPTINKNLKDTFKEKFTVEDETMVTFDLALATIAQDLQTVKNLFSKDQAERIEKWVYKCIDTENWGQYAIEEVKKYGEAFQKSLELPEIPVYGTGTVLLYRWLGVNLRNFEVKMGEERRVIDPLLIMAVAGILASFLGYWKTIKENFELVEGDLPLSDINWEERGLNDFRPELEEIKPDGTFSICDEQGNLKEKWLPPEQLDELLKRVGAKRVYEVLIKGPWEGIKEAYWELSDESVIKFVDEKGYAYAICDYKKGEPKYYLVTKRLWEKSDEIEVIISDPYLSQKQKQEKIKKMLNG